MQIQVLNITRTKYENLGFYVFMEMQEGKTHVTVTVGPDHVNVCSHNASNKAWRGTGRRFVTADEAIAGYKTAAIKEMIRLAVQTKAETPIEAYEASSTKKTHENGRC